MYNIRILNKKLPETIMHFLCSPEVTLHFQSSLYEPKSLIFSCFSDVMEDKMRYTYSFCLSLIFESIFYIKNKRMRTIFQVTNNGWMKSTEKKSKLEKIQISFHPMTLFIKILNILWCIIILVPIVKFDV